MSQGYKYSIVWAKWELTAVLISSYCTWPPDCKKTVLHAIWLNSSYVCLEDIKTKVMAEFSSSKKDSKIIRFLTFTLLVCDLVTYTYIHIL